MIDIADNDLELCARVRAEVRQGAKVSPGFRSIRADRDGYLVRYERVALGELAILRSNDVPGCVVPVSTFVQ